MSVEQLPGQSRSERRRARRKVLGVVDVNLSGTMRMCAACRPLLARRGGSVVNLASMLSFFGSGYAPAYSASKGGVAQLTKSLAIAWAKSGVRVNAVAPGPVLAPPGTTNEELAAVERSTPLARWGGEQEIAKAVLALLDSDFITGETIRVDGGRHLR